MLGSALSLIGELKKYSLFEQLRSGKVVVFPFIFLPHPSIPSLRKGTLGRFAPYLVRIKV